MDKLKLGIEIRDFDLERMGALSVMDRVGKGSASEAYLRMTLTELNAFLKALRSAQGDIDMSTIELTAGRKMPTASVEPIAAESASSASDTVIPNRRR
jgi:hypothetical protein